MEPCGRDEKFLALRSELRGHLILFALIVILFAALAYAGKATVGGTPGFVGSLAIPAVFFGVAAVILLFSIVRIMDKMNSLKIENVIREIGIKNVVRDEMRRTEILMQPTLRDVRREVVLHGDARVGRSDGTERDALTSEPKEKVARAGEIGEADIARIALRAKNMTKRSKD